MILVGVLDCLGSLTCQELIHSHGADVFSLDSPCNLIIMQSIAETL